MKLIQLLLFLAISPGFLGAQTLTGNWKASAISLEGNFYDLQGAETEDDFHKYLNDMQIKYHSGKALSSEDSVQYGMVFSMMLHMFGKTSIEFTADGKVILSTPEQLGSEHATPEHGTYKLNDKNITSDLKKNGATNLVILSFTADELVLSGFGDSDKFPVRFKRVK